MTEILPASPVAAPSSRRPLRIALAVGIVFAATVGTATIVAAVPHGGPDEGALVRACRDQVAARLRAPAAAQWPGGERVWRDQARDRVWEARGVVDAQNAFGALIRSPWTCTGVWNADRHRWGYVDASLSGQSDR